MGKMQMMTTTAGRSDVQALAYDSDAAVVFNAASYNSDATVEFNDVTKRPSRDDNKRIASRYDDGQIVAEVDDLEVKDKILSRNDSQMGDSVITLKTAKGVELGCMALVRCTTHGLVFVEY